MMKVIRSFFLITGLLFIFNSSWTQLTEIYTEKYKSYRDGLELYDKGAYSAAQEKFKQVIEEIDNGQDEIQISAEYLQAVCALELFHKDAQYLLSTFALKHPDSPKTKKIFFLLGNDFYRRKKHKEAIEWYEKVDKFDLSADEKTEYFFKLGYSYFNKEEFTKAKQSFYEIKDDKESDYYAPTQYYYSHLSYQDKQYQTAIEGFKKIKDNPDFAPIVPYYISQILFKQQKYEEAISYIPSALSGDDIKREAEIKGILGSSYFKLKQYQQALPYLEEYFKKTAKKSTDDYYQLGYSYFKTADYESAIKYLGRVASKQTERAQVCNFLLAECYIKTENKQFAKVAFKIAYDLGFNAQINEDALFGYGKTTYELSYNPYDEATEIFHKFLTEFPSSTKKEEVYEYLLDVYTTTKNYEAALQSIDRITEKNYKIKEAYQKLSYNRATELYYKSEFDKALKYYGDVSNYSINAGLTSKSKFWIAETQYKQKKYDKAILGYSQFKSMPGAVNSELANLVDYNIGYAYFEQEDYNKSITAFRNYVKSASNQEKKSDAYLRLGDSYFLLNNDEEAVKHYQSAIDLDQKNVDYAIFQKSVSAGYLADYLEKERLLNLLLANYPNSTYSTNTVFELANNYRVQNKNEQAIKYYKQIVQNQNGTYQERKSRLEIGGIYLRDKKYDLAETELKDLIRKYPKSIEGEAAINEIEKSYLAQNKIAEFPDLLTSLGIKYSQSKLDSTLWYPANQAYLSADCNNAKSGLSGYLSKIEQPINYVTAHFYLAECNYIEKEYETALFHYIKVIERNEKHMVEALFHGANIHFRLKQFVEANNLFIQLEKINTDELKIPTMNKGLMLTHYKLENYAQAITAADKVLKNGQLMRAEKEEAYMIKGTSNYTLGFNLEAETAFKKVVELSTDIDKSEAGYKLCEIHFIKGEYKQTEAEIFAYIKQKPSYDYWLAKGFILLADVYVKLEDTFQAKATLQSIIDGYKGTDDIITIAQTKLAAIKAAEDAKDNKEEEDIEIEIQNN
jgi:tetratricopeptide (TPR) repeat protein